MGDRENMVDELLSIQQSLSKVRGGCEAHTDAFNEISSAMICVIRAITAVE